MFNKRVWQPAAASHGVTWRHMAPAVSTFNSNKRREHARGSTVLPGATDSRLLRHKGQILNGLASSEPLPFVTKSQRAFFVVYFMALP
jgi:hypothetical protein